jgi:hypothetical protein
VGIPRRSYRRRLRYLGDGIRHYRIGLVSSHGLA